MGKGTFVSDPLARMPVGLSVLDDSAYSTPNEHRCTNCYRAHTVLIAVRGGCYLQLLAGACAQCESRIV